MERDAVDQADGSEAPTSLEPGGARPAWAVALDFTAKTDEPCPIDKVPDAIRGGKFVWIDLALTDSCAHDALFAALGIPQEVADDVRSRDAGTQLARYASCLHMVFAGCHLVDNDLELERVDIIVGEQFLVTSHRGQARFVDSVKRDYHDDFVHHAQTPSFLVYELWDHLVDHYVALQNEFEEQVEALQGRLAGEVDDEVFAAISDLGSDLLHFRKVLLPARAVLVDLATRHSRFISEATRPFLANMGGTVERVLQDLLVDREILSDSLNLYLSAVSHRTNEVMRRLTVVSVIFLPLTFLVGVYGMNFEVLPELKWKFGYGLFWLAVAGIVGGLLWLMSRKRLL